MTDRAALQRWMAAAADGDRTAVDPLFHTLWPVLVAYATRFVGDAALAEDCAQEAIVKLYGQLARFDRERDALTWALTLVTWQCRTARRTIVRRAEHGASSAAEGRGGSIDGTRAAEDRDLIRAAIETVAGLAPHDRDVITASLVDDDPLRRELAPATFRKRLERALARLRTSWRSRHGTL